MVLGRGQSTSIRYCGRMSCEDEKVPELQKNGKSLYIACPYQSQSLMVK